MAHYAFIASGVVQQVLVGIDEDNTTDLPEGYNNWEQYYSEKMGMICKRTSYNTYANQHKTNGTPFRGNYAGIGDIYDEVNDVFYRPQPFDSWILNTNTWLWEAPVPYPDSDNDYDWNETTQTWDLRQDTELPGINHNLDYLN